MAYTGAPDRMIKMEEKMITSLYQSLCNMETNIADRVALRWYDEKKQGVAEVHYAQYAQDLRRFVAFLRAEYGDVRGKRVAILARNSYQYVICMYGTVIAGAVAVPLNLGKDWDAISYELGLTEPVCILQDGEFAEREPALAETYGSILKPMDVFAAYEPAEDVTEVEDLSALAFIMFASGKAFGSKGAYSFNSYMHGRQYYFGLSAGAAYKVNDNFSVYAGLRGIYATCNYYGYVEDIKVGNMPLYQVLDPSKENSANIELSCDQSGIGFTPMLAVDYKTGRWNFSAKYEFKTRMRLKNKSVNKLPSIGNLDDNLKNQMNKLFTGTFMAAGLPQEQAMIKAEQTSTKVLEDPTVVATTAGLKQQFDSKINEALGEYADGKKIAGDIPSLLTVGVGYSPIDELHINVGFHWFDDYNATSYNNRNKLLKKRGTLEFNAGVEYDVTKKITVSTGWQNTNYGLTDKYMDDKSFVVGSNSVGLGGVYHITKKLDFSVAYFHTFYNHVKTSETVTLAPGVSNTYNSDYTRNNNAFAAGVNITF